MTTAAGFIALRSQFADQMQVCLEASKGRKELEMSPLKASFVGVASSELEKKTAMDQVHEACLFIICIDFHFSFFHFHSIFLFSSLRPFVIYSTSSSAQIWRWKSVSSATAS